MTRTTTSNRTNDETSNDDTVEDINGTTGTAAAVNTTTTTTTAEAQQQQQQQQQGAVLIDLLQKQSIGSNDTTVSETNNTTTAVNGEVSNTTTQTTSSSLTLEQQQLIEAIDPRYNRRLAHESSSTVTGGVTNNNDKKHAFWDTQPMPRTEVRNAQPEYDGPIVPDKDINEIRQEPYTMPAGFVWSNVNVCDTKQLDELYMLLTNNYVEDDDALFRFDYSTAFLLWALDPPDSNPDFIFGVRSATTNKLMAFISGIPTTIMVHTRTIKVVEVNFLCVHKKLRSKRLAPVLIKEITRRVNRTGVFQAVYTAGQLLPAPVGSARYHHRSLNPKKLINIGFSRLPTNSHRMTMARLVKLYRLPETPVTPGLRPMNSTDVKGVHKLLNRYLQQFSIKVLFTVNDIAHWLLPRPNVINSYVIVQDESADDDKKIVTDFISFYHLHSSVLHHNDKLYAAYSYYNVATTVPITQLMKDALIIARNDNCDVFNALDLMENKSFLSELKFGIGDGVLQYYIYNWVCPIVQPEGVGIVLL